MRHSLWSIVVFLCCVAVFVASWTMFHLLDRRWTRQRQWTRMGDWARRQGWNLRRGPLEPPRALDSLSVGARVIRGLASPRTRLLQVQTATTTDALPTRWNLLVRTLAAEWPATALRPAGAAACLVDTFHLGIFAALSTAGRFTALGTDAGAAARLTGSAVRGLLPADIALLLVGNELILDFSARPFDPIAFDRLLAIADQIEKHLPRV